MNAHPDKAIRDAEAILLRGVAAAYGIDDHTDPKTDDCAICCGLIGNESWFWKKMSAGGFGRAHHRCDTECPACGGEWINLHEPCPSCGTTIEFVAEGIAEATSGR